MPTPPSPPPPRSGRPCCPSWRRPPMALSDHPRYPLLFGPSPAHRLDRLTQPPGGADVRLVKAGFGIGFKESWEAALAEIEARGGKPYAIPAGASDHPLGGLGFASWAEEVAAQEAELGVFFDTVVVCSVTGSTQAGMVAGFAKLEEDGARPRRGLDVDAPAQAPPARDQVPRSAHRPAPAG